MTEIDKEQKQGQESFFVNTEDIYKANRLIYLSIAYSSSNKRIVSQNNTELTELIQRFQAEEPFRQMVEAGLKAMELRLLALEDSGLRLSAHRADSFFATNLTDYGRLLARGDLRAADVLPVHCAIAAAFFPSESDLDAPVEDLGAVVIEDVVGILRRFVQKEFDLADDDRRLSSQIRTVAQRLRELPEDNPDRLRAGSGTSWMDLINRVLEHMAETGYLLVFEETPGEVEYRPTPAYQTAMREGIVYSFHAFRDIVKDKNSSKTSSVPDEKKDVSTP